MLTVDYERLGLRPGDRLLDLGCGAGRHAFESLRRGARVIAFDYDEAELKDVAAMAGAMDTGGDLSKEARSSCARGDATALPFTDARFDRIIAAEVLEHISDDAAAISELVRVLRPGGTMAVTVPAFLAERICWALSDEYHAPHVEGGHVRIYTAAEMRTNLVAAGVEPYDSHKEHGIHAPYWWLRCAVGPTNDDHPLVRAYHQALCWDIGGAQPWSRFTRAADRVLTPVIGKSYVVYARKPGASEAAA
ncbi:MAG TPA: methyltransferase domain-containing protein [Acidimicrobiales bacterium]|nr:methyltransferase domain-containing protein [Acidimicrobiales bacterium]